MDIRAIIIAPQITTDVMKERTITDKITTEKETLTIVKIEKLITKLSIEESKKKKHINRNIGMIAEVSTGVIN